MTRRHSGKRGERKYISPRMRMGGLSLMGALGSRPEARAARICSGEWTSKAKRMSSERDIVGLEHFGAGWGTGI